MFKLCADLNRPEINRRLSLNYITAWPGEPKISFFGVTGSGKTFTKANVIQKVQRPTLIITHNKTLAAHLYTDLGNFFRTMLWNILLVIMITISPSLNTFNGYLYEKMPLLMKESTAETFATKSLMTRKDVIVVASVSCIYGLGLPEEYFEHVLYLKKGQA
jgi:excinuclease ABC subunit B